MEYGSEQYPGFFTHHALGFVRQDTADGKQQMRADLGSTSWMR